nr:MAG TPA: Repressor protein CI [Caudoviricetes sp.]
MEFKDRLNMLLEHKNVSQRQLALAIGISPQSVQQWAKGQAKPSAERLQSVAEFFDVSPSYLMFGEEFAQCQEADDDTISIPVLNVRGSCGINHAITDMVEMVKLLRVAKKWLVEKVGVVNFKKLHIITAVGDSMSPTFSDGDFVIVDTSKTEVIGDGIYAVQAGGGIFIKRLQRKLDGGVTLLSDNEKYKPMDVPVEDLDSMSVIGKCIISCCAKEI